MQPYHPLLPSAQQAQQDPFGIYSDHCPTFYQFPVVDEEIRIVSSNLLVPNLFSGYFPYHEDTSQQQARADRILATLKIFFTKLAPHVFVLQETWLTDKQLQRLCSSFNTNWKMIRQGTQTMFYDNAVLAFEADHGIDREIVHTVDFRYKDLPLRLCNAHIPHQDIPTATELAIIRHLQSSSHVIVVGDLNSRCAPLDNRERLIITNVASAEFRDHQGQGCDWTDGGFYSNGDNACHQGMKQILDIESGEPLTDLPIIQNDDLSEFQYGEIHNHRLMLCVDDRYRDVKALSEQFGNDGLSVHMAVNAHNDKQIGVLVPAGLDRKIDHLIDQFQDHSDIHFHRQYTFNNPAGYPQFFMPQTSFTTFVDAFQVL